MELQKITARKKRRLGQGHGSGRGKTAGRGTKGQKARGDIPLRFEGGAISLLKRLPFLRGKERNKTFQKKTIAVKLSALNVFKTGSTIDIKSLVEQKIVNASEAEQFGVKILSDGELNVVLTVSLPVSKGAQGKIEKAGGKVAS